SALGPIGVPNAVLLAFASGIAEEMFFRGALQPRVGLVAASVLFALLHFLPRRALWPWTVFALAAGLLFGGLFQWTGNLIAPVTAHIVVNAVNLPVLERRFGQAAREP
ncbi:MAG: CPBP family intramembrane metalloprotease, partial [Myxococcota bacterium]|nr:CPBP family intramembrane metalloprotease [Myxococcota bacterium]